MHAAPAAGQAQGCMEPGGSYAPQASQAWQTALHEYLTSGSMSAGLQTDGSKERSSLSHGAAVQSNAMAQEEPVQGESTVQVKVSGSELARW